MGQALVPLGLVLAGLWWYGAVGGAEGLSACLESLRATILRLRLSF